MTRDISELDDNAQLLRVSWRKAHNYHVHFARAFLEVKKRIDSGEFGPEWTSSKWLLHKAGMFERQIVQMLLVYSRVMASEERDKLLEMKAQAEAEKRASKLRVQKGCAPASYRASRGAWTARG